MEVKAGGAGAEPSHSKRSGSPSSKVARKRKGGGTDAEGRCCGSRREVEAEGMQKGSGVEVEAEGRLKQKRGRRGREVEVEAEA